jgi:hypothetical protein
MHKMVTSTVDNKYQLITMLNFTKDYFQRIDDKVIFKEKEKQSRIYTYKEKQ